jgi:hypothetical protein
MNPLNETEALSMQLSNNIRESQDGKTCYNIYALDAYLRKLVKMILIVN